MDEDATRRTMAHHDGTADRPAADDEAHGGAYEAYGGAYEAHGGSGELWAADLDDDLVDEPWADGGPGTEDEAPPLIGRILEDGRDALDVLLRFVGPERDGPPALWFLVLDATDRVLPLVLPIAEVPTVPDAVVSANLVHVLASVLEHDAPGGSVVVGYVRGGGGDRGAFEAGWSAALHISAHREDVRIRAEAAIGCDRARILSTCW
ncbi:MAG: hypothetical protein ACOH17_05480 [Cellulomonas sp.]